MIEVTAGIIFKNDKILIAKRPYDKKFGGKWELPGGKLEVGESIEDCMKRELKEELNISIKGHEYYISSDHEYDTFKVRIHSFLIRDYIGEISLIEHEDIHWINPEDYQNYDILAADLPFIKKIIRGEYE
ncbi:(deoxy)nucleoside triphosphate pyrophosphohydrolase [uncultured Ilyobacter sp.]|uniref:(deoxy)nucleoside triphosphate pyrophosphohydrolase n=1 Tax=uncultured Ilyobacter sp. TaxID=544433 RepID=UPI0029C0654D|nr:(deoxy)nucleoside triphosphate pyrophosphohydrolase [uncultured Ilyobacter sp.]